MRLLRLFLLVLCVTLACAAARAADAPPPPAPGNENSKDEPVDPDVLHKVHKLIRGTLSSDDKEREKAWNDIRDMGNLAVPGLIGVYRQKTTTPEEVRSILLALGDSKDPRAGPALAELLTSTDKSVRRDAARAMGDSGYKGGIPALEKVAQDVKEDEDVRLFAGSAAAKLGDADALKVLSALLKSTRPEIRSRAVFAIGKNGGVAHVAEIEKALEDTDASVREDAVEALRLLGKEPVWPGLIKATSDTDYKIRGAAMDALRQVTKQKFDNDPKKWQDWFKNGAKPEAPKSDEEKANDAANKDLKEKVKDKLKSRDKSDESKTDDGMDGTSSEGKDD